LGLALIATGHLGLATLVQYLPMPVVGGYLAFIGFFCFEAGLSLMAHTEITGVGDFGKLWHSDWNQIWPGVVSGLVIYAVLRYTRSASVLPLSMAVMLASFYAVLGLSGTTLADARESGWVSKLPEETPMFWQPYEWFDFPKVHWDVVPHIVPTWVAMYFVVAFSSSLDVAAIEIDLGVPLDYNHELMTVGFSNAMSGLTGGYTGSYIFSQTIFTMRSKTNSRMNGGVIIGCQLATFMLPVSVISYVPRMFFGSLLTFIAVDLMLVLARFLPHTPFQTHVCHRDMMRVCVTCSRVEQG
jgi:SulP family sulfate permease